MRDYLKKKCEQILYLNPQLSPEIKFKTEAFWFVFKSICYNIFTNLQKRICWWGEQKRAELKTQTLDNINLKAIFGRYYRKMDNSKNCTFIHDQLVNFIYLKIF